MAHTRELAHRLIAMNAFQSADAFDSERNVGARAGNRRAYELTCLCKFYAKGRCRNGSACTFAHDESELQPRPDFYKFRLCAAFAALGSCSAGAGCKFAHGPQELRRPFVPKKAPVVRGATVAEGGQFPEIQQQQRQHQQAPQLQQARLQLHHHQQSPQRHESEGWSPWQCHRQQAQLPSQRPQPEPRHQQQHHHHGQQQLVTVPTLPQEIMHLQQHPQQEQQARTGSVSDWRTWVAAPEEMQLQVQPLRVQVVDPAAPVREAHVTGTADSGDACGVGVGASSWSRYSTEEAPLEPAAGDLWVPSSAGIHLFREFEDTQATGEEAEVRQRMETQEAWVPGDTRGGQRISPREGGRPYEGFLGGPSVDLGPSVCYWRVT